MPDKTFRAKPWYTGAFQAAGIILLLVVSGYACTLPFAFGRIDGYTSSFSKIVCSILPLSFILFWPWVMWLMGRKRQTGVVVGYIITYILGSIFIFQSRLQMLAVFVLIPCFFLPFKDMSNTVLAHANYILPFAFPAINILIYFLGLKHGGKASKKSNKE